MIPLLGGGDCDHTSRAMLPSLNLTAHFSKISVSFERLHQDRVRGIEIA